MLNNTVAANLLAGLDLGSAVAETDDLLEDARVETSVFDDLLADRVDLIPGTKGSGKTALYRMFVEFLPAAMLQQRRVVIAHGVKPREDTVFLAYKKQFDQLSEADFVDFWCIYFVSLAYEQFVRADPFQALLVNCANETADFRAAYAHAGIPDFERRKSLREIIGWALAVLKRVKPRVTWTPPGDVGQIEMDLEINAPTPRQPLQDDDPRMPAYIDAIAAALHRLLNKADLFLWLMVDRLDELFARRSETETRALRGLLRTLRLFSSDRIRLKIFLRDDILEQIASSHGFTALTHVTARRSDTLRWSEEQILSMVVRRIFANEDIRAHFDVNATTLASSIDYQRQVFYRIFTDTVYRPPNQSSTLRWIYNHCKDGRGVVTPRDVIGLLTRAIQWQRDALRRDPTSSTGRLITGQAITYGLDEMSKEKRTNYLEAEFPHMWQRIRKLVGGGTEYSESAVRRLFGTQHQRTTDDLVSIGLLERATRGGAPSFRVPYLYRHGLECTQRFVAN